MGKAIGLVLGALFLLLAVKQWRSRPEAGEEAVMPKWMRTIDTFKAGKAIIGGVVPSGLNPKNKLIGDAISGLSE